MKNKKGGSYRSFTRKVRNEKIWRVRGKSKKEAEENEKAERTAGRELE